jgi:hypothetical protein
MLSRKTRNVGHPQQHIVSPVVENISHSSHVEHQWRKIMTQIEFDNKNIFL